ncbi:hypothetical protein [Fredinandcohnia quinoae]|uniref:Uncharacterized protein n=1 Tax=Fredinandcohnia quinoae TaxID=2918902 RepID=A0AAW5E0M1_9BACI|nr:hypothetical protein [Fredinandcohnia sp. SECRCQ15]MCH1626462.1 hypothetical protein [Fredinandcohnia sp. SECRCQ15]
MKYCNQCGAEMIEDAMEEITFDEDDVKIDGFHAFVCTKNCGYYEKIERNCNDE